MKFVVGNFGLDGAVDFGERVESFLADGIFERMGIDYLQVFKDLFIHLL